MQDELIRWKKFIKNSWPTNCMNKNPEKSSDLFLLNESTRILRNTFVILDIQNLKVTAFETFEIYFA